MNLEKLPSHSEDLSSSPKFAKNTKDKPFN
jgi:hypothetical protein